MQVRPQGFIKSWLFSENHLVQMMQHQQKLLWVAVSSKIVPWRLHFEYISKVLKHSLFKKKKIIFTFYWSKIHHLSILKYNAMTFSTFTMLYKHSHYVNSEHSSISKRNPMPISSHSYSFLAPVSASTNLLSVSIDLPILSFPINGIIQ